MFLSLRRIAPFSAVVLLLPLAPFASSQVSGNNPSRVEAIRFWSFGDVTRIAIETSGEYKLASDQIENPSRVYFDFNGLRPPASAHHGIQTIQVGDHRIKQIRIAQITPRRTRVVFDLEFPVEVVSSQLVNPDRLMIEIRPKASNAPGVSVAQAETSKPPIEAVKTDPAPPSDRETTAANIAAAATPAPTTATGITMAKRDSSGDRSLVRVFGLKLGRVVIDPGHGGHDTGTIGPNGLTEKDLVLDVALRLGKLISRNLGADVVYTRSTDVFIPLEQRTKIANDQKADLFISVHANSSPEPSATGVETYYFNLTSDKRGLDLATRENATSVSSISDLNDMLHRAVLQTKLEESREFAQRVQASLWANSVKMNSRSRNRGVRQAPFVVLIGATMPSILAEVGFVSNPRDERLMKRSEQREKIAEALYKGIFQYANSLSHVQIARAGSE